MITHIVLLKVKTNFDYTLVMNNLERFRVFTSDEYKFASSFHCGVNNSPEGLNHDYNYGFTMTFENSNLRDEYLTNDYHIKLSKELILPLLENTTHSLIVFDL